MAFMVGSFAAGLSSGLESGWKLGKDVRAYQQRADAISAAEKEKKDKAGLPPLIDVSAKAPSPTDPDMPAGMSTGSTNLTGDGYDPGSDAGNTPVKLDKDGKVPTGAEPAQPALLSPTTTPSEAATRTPEAQRAPPSMKSGEYVAPVPPDSAGGYRPLGLDAADWLGRQVDTATPSQRPASLLGYDQPATPQTALPTDSRPPGIIAKDWLGRRLNTVTPSQRPASWFAPSPSGAAPPRSGMVGGALPGSAPATVALPPPSSATGSPVATAPIPPPLSSPAPTSTTPPTSAIQTSPSIAARLETINRNRAANGYPPLGLSDLGL